MRLNFAGSAIFVNEAVLILPVVSGDHSQQFRALLMCMTVVHDQMRRSVEGGDVGCQWVYFNSTRVYFIFARSAHFHQRICSCFVPAYQMIRLSSLEFCEFCEVLWSILSSKVVV